MSGLFGSTTIKGTRLTDFSATSAEVGKAIPFGYGTFPVDGFIGWAPLPPVEHRKVKRQGKGGVKQETYTYTLSYAVFFCKGPIYGVKWIKRNGKVVYTTDPNAPIEDRQYAAKWAQRVNFHWGTRDQLPDSLIESYEGVGNVSGFPDMFYITVEDEDVTDNGGAPPNYEACVIVGAATSYTTPPYPVFVKDALTPSIAPSDSTTLSAPRDSFSASITPLDCDLEVVVRYLTYQYEPEPLTVSMQPLNVDLQVVVGYLTYNYDPEPLTVSMQPLNGDLQVVVIAYQNYDPEPLTVSMQPLDSDLTVV